MLKFAATAIAVAMIPFAAVRQTKLIRPPEPFGLNMTFVENMQLKGALRNAMLNPLCALHCLYAPPGFGKSRAITTTATELVNRGHLSGAVVLCADNNVRERNLNNWLKLRLGLQSSTLSLPELLPANDGPDHRPFLIVLDQFDQAVANPYLTGFIESLATDSVRAKNFVVLVAVSNVDLYNQILRMNGGQKIQSVYGNISDLPRWDAGMLWRLYYEKRSVWRLDHLEPVLDQLIAIAAQVGTPEFLLSFLNLPRAQQTVPEMIRRRDRFLLMYN